jgi:hypothetical protein
MNNDTTDLYEIVGGTPGDAIDAVQALLKIVDIEDPNHVGLYYIHTISCCLLKRAYQEIERKTDALN